MYNVHSTLNKRATHATRVRHLHFLVWWLFFWPQQNIPKIDVDFALRALVQSSAKRNQLWALNASIGFMFPLIHIVPYTQFDRRSVLRPIAATNVRTRKHQFNAYRKIINISWWFNWRTFSKLYYFECNDVDAERQWHLTSLQIQICSIEMYTVAYLLDGHVQQERYVTRKTKQNEKPHLVDSNRWSISHTIKFIS